MSNGSKGKQDKVTVQLSEAVKHGEDDYRVLEIRKPKGKHLRNMPMEPTMGDMLNLAAELAEVPYSVMDELEWVDLEKVMDAVGNFMPAGPGTGKKK